MKLVRLRFQQYHINPWGYREMGSHYRVLDTVDVWENGEFKMFGNGYEPPYSCPVWESDDGRTWVAVQNHIDYWGGTWCTWYMKLFKEPRDPALSIYEVGPSTYWEEYSKAAKMKLVNEAELAVDIEGNLL